MKSLKPPQCFLDGCSAIGLDLDPDRQAILGAYLSLLLETNRQFNLTSIRDPRDVWMKHILESLSLLRFLENEQTLIDVGSGGGLPGVPLAIVRSGLKVTLLEATKKKASFLERTKKEFNLENLQIVARRAEVIGQDPDHREHYDIVVARAVASMRELCELTIPLVCTGGRVLALKGQAAEQELEQAQSALSLLGAESLGIHEALPGCNSEAVVAVVRKLTRTDSAYPRRPGIPHKRPL